MDDVQDSAAVPRGRLHFLWHRQVLQRRDQLDRTLRWGVPDRLDRRREPRETLRETAEPNPTADIASHPT